MLQIPVSARFGECITVSFNFKVRLREQHGKCSDAAFICRPIVAFSMVLRLGGCVAGTPKIVAFQRAVCIKITHYAALPCKLQLVSINLTLCAFFSGLDLHNPSSALQSGNQPSKMV